MTSSPIHRRRSTSILLALGSVFAMLLMALPVAAATEHCPDGGSKVEANGGTQDTINETVLPAGTQFCVKGSTDATGLLTADGETSLSDYLGNDHDVSYYVVYTTTTSTPTPTGTPTSGHPDTEISKSASVSEIDAGGSFDYTLTVVNDGSALATGVIVSDNLDNDLIVNSVTPSQGTCDPVAAGNQVRCEIGDLDVDATATVIINVTAPAAACPSVDNRASVTADNELNDDDTLEVSRSQVVVVEVTCPSETATPTPTPTPSETPASTPTPTPEGSQAGSTGTPKASATPEGSVAAATGTPKPLPNTATDPTSPNALIVLGFGLLLLGSIGTLSYASVAARRRND